MTHPSRHWVTTAPGVLASHSAPPYTVPRPSQPTGDDQEQPRRVRPPGAEPPTLIARARRSPELSGFLLTVFASAAILLFTASPQPQALDYFNRLADAFLHGRIWLDQAPSWLNELIPVAGASNEWYVTYPPMPAILAMPFVALFGASFPAQVYSSLYGALDAGLAFLLLGRLNLGLRLRDRFALTGVFTFGTVFWFVAIGGSAWYFAHVAAVLFVLAAVLVALSHRAVWAAGFLIGCAALSRLPTGLAALFVLAAALDFPRSLHDIDWRRAIRTTVVFGLGLAIPALAYIAYNEVRWGTVTDQGYVLIPGVLQDPIYAKHGILSVWYIPRNLFAILFRSWNYVDDAPWLQPSWWGLGIFLTTPLYLWLAKANWRSPMVWWAAVSTVLVSLPIITHGNVGISQFGYRFSLDFQVLLFVILATAFAAGRWTWRSVTAAVLSVGFCAYAIWAIGIGFVAY
jgi:hypothetical protein